MLRWAAADDLEGLSKGEMLSMLRFGADRIFQNSEGRPPSDEDLDAIIDRSDKLGEAGAHSSARSGPTAHSACSVQQGTSLQDHRCLNAQKQARGQRST